MLETIASSKIVTKNHLIQNSDQLHAIHLELIKRNIIQFDHKKNKFSINPDIDIATIPKSLDFDDIAIVQKKNQCQSRLEACTESEIIKGIKVKYPLIASNMSTVINESFYEKIHKLGAFAIMHRADSDDNLISAASRLSKKCEWVAFSIGVGNGQFELAKNLINAGANVIVIDIAHGYSDIVFNLGKQIKTNYPHVKLVIGNTTNTEMLLESHDFIDGIKVGIGGGCFVAGTLVQTKNGLKPIEKIQKGEQILTHRGRYKTVTNTHQRKEEEKLFNINGNKCTGNHEFYVLKKIYRDTVTDDNINEYAEWIPAEKLNDNYYLLKTKE